MQRVALVPVTMFAPRRPGDAVALYSDTTSVTREPQLGSETVRHRHRRVDRVEFPSPRLGHRQQGNPTATSVMSATSSAGLVPIKVRVRSYKKLCISGAEFYRPHSAAK